MFVMINFIVSILYCIKLIEYTNNFTWEQYLNGQSRNTKMTGEFIMATAVLIGLDYHINSPIYYH